MGPVTPLLRISNLTKRYGRVIALQDVSFAVHAGEVLGLIGPNGSGKTTLFECLGGVLPRDSGELLRGDRPITSAERLQLLFYIPDSIAPWPSQTVRWALDFAIGFFGGNRERRDEIVQRLGITPFLDVTMGALSKGQRKRAVLALGLLAPQPVLLADEPFDGLDLRQTREVAQVLREHAMRGRTMFLSIHQISDAARVCDRFVLLSNGRSVGEGAFAGQDLEEVFLALT
jgi:ABC-2 type transport system ATP-binding protein